MNPNVHFVKVSDGGRKNALVRERVSKYEKALTGSQKTINSMEGWHRVFHQGTGLAKYKWGNILSFFGRAQNWTEVKIGQKTRNSRAEIQSALKLTRGCK